ncbi:MAG TPA: response regulator [Candidatus Nanopelagicaceae bacterium]|nr:response regulator [Candidatus Nanopelagicaceae bacterium]
MRLLIQILVVEDDLDTRLLIERIIREDAQLAICGHSDSADDAITLAQLFSPDLVILDHHIEGQATGLEIAPLIKAVASDTKIILFTSENVLDEIDSQGAIDSYLPKTDIQKLLPTIQNLMF